jgi:hypothetical protein
MPRKRIGRVAPEAKAWVIELVSKPPSAVGVTVGSKGRQGDELWTLMALRRYAREHGPKALARVGTDTLKAWLLAPEVRDKVKLWGAEPKQPKGEREPPAKKLPLAARGQLSALKPGLNGFGRRGEDESPPTISLPIVYFATRPELPQSDRERLGADYKAPPARVEVKFKDDEVIAEGEAALRRIRGAAPMKDWLAIGRALLVLRKKAMAETDAKKPRGILYVTRNHALLRQHGFLAISKSARQTAMLIVENLPAIEAWLKKLPDERRISLNHPMCVWRSYLAAKKRHEHSSKGGWRDRKTMPEEDFARLVEAMAESLETHDPIQPPLRRRGRWGMRFRGVCSVASTIMFVGRSP